MQIDTLVTKKIYMQRFNSYLAIYLTLWLYTDVKHMHGETNNNGAPVVSHPSKAAIKFVWRLS